MSFELSTQGGGGMKIKKWKSVSKTIVRGEMTGQRYGWMLVNFWSRENSVMGEQSLSRRPTSCHPSTDDHPDNNLNLYDLHYLICLLDSKEQRIYMSIHNTHVIHTQYINLDFQMNVILGWKFAANSLREEVMTFHIKCLPGKEGLWVVTVMVVPDMWCSSMKPCTSPCLLSSIWEQKWLFTNPPCHLVDELNKGSHTNFLPPQCI